VNASTMRWTWYQSSDGVVYDDLIITQEYPVKPWVLPTDSDSASKNNDIEDWEDWGVAGGTLVVILIVFFVGRKYLWRTVLSPSAGVIEESHYDGKAPAEFADAGREHRMKSVEMGQAAVANGDAGVAACGAVGNPMQADKDSEV
jgi:hypothetical protein